MLSQIISQTDLSARLLERAQSGMQNVRGLRSGDRVYTPLIATAEFNQGASQSQNLVFNVPSDADFWAYRFLLYPYCKVIDPENGTPDEITYRSTSFVGESFSSGFTPQGNTYTDILSAVDGTFAFISEGKELQNVDIPMSAAYCTNVGKWGLQGPLAAGGTWKAASQTPGGMVFDIPMFIPRGKSVMVRITPTYLGIRTINELAPDATLVRQHKYKFVAVLDGEKKVTALR